MIVNNLLIPRNLEGRKEKLKQMNIRLLSQEVIDGNLVLDQSFMDIDVKYVKLKKVNGDVLLAGGKWVEIPEWLKKVEIEGDFSCGYNRLTTLKNCPQMIGRSFSCLYNNLKNLRGCPEKIVWNFNCSNNNLVSLEDCPKTVEGIFWCHTNNVELKLPDHVKLKGSFYNSISFL